ncbi:sigma-70 family RNA polymerase sigma factor [Micromonospora sp. WMMD882]|uniref:sigma-70 family RNA polymerase sigma factor n=1 Tax=Micromonospora sp. WMMD882 TaxID=3015151 RepID=UPI00248C7775|nr:sigma-70 family RNA polymerase sigma factor [Micromonospora sp. WMMD882]WBB78687.1 sigma-70 family RNA polymerase sigma factor [Micromonospora sp. WMMD882]
MSRVGTGQSEEPAVVDAVRAGDEAAFAELTERHRRELHVHCYRMLGSFDDAEDLVQETFLRAWRRRETFQGRSTFRAWLYRIATNACLDFVERHPRRPRGALTTTPAPAGPASAAAFPQVEIPWLQPYPDRLLEPVASPDAEPDTAVIAKETIELAFLAAIQHLPPKQRAVLILRDVLGWPANDTAALLNGTVPAVNSALQRARLTLKQHLPQRRSEWAAVTDPSEEERAVLQRYVRATENADLAGLAELLREDARFTMPPKPTWYVGRATIIETWTPVLVGPNAWRDWRHVLTRANRQPAVACYVRPEGADRYHALGLDVLRIEDGAVAEITAFQPEVFPAFGLPLTV